MLTIKLAFIRDRLEFRRYVLGRLAPANYSRPPNYFDLITLDTAADHRIVIRFGRVGSFAFTWKGKVKRGILIFTGLFSTDQTISVRYVQRRGTGSSGEDCDSSMRSWVFVVDWLTSHYRSLRHRSSSCPFPRIFRSFATAFSFLHFVVAIASSGRREAENRAAGRSSRLVPRSLSLFLANADFTSLFISLRCTTSVFPVFGRRILFCGDFQHY